MLINKIFQFFRLDFIVVFILTIYAGGATTFVRSLGTWEEINGVLFINLIIISFAIYKKIKFDKRFFILVISWVIYNLLLSFKYEVIHPRFFFLYLNYFLICFVIIKTLKYKFFILFERAVVFLAFIGLVFWFLQNINPSLIDTLSGFLSFSSPATNNVGYNMIIYTVSSSEFLSNLYLINFEGFSVVRNCGFAWEPGAFSIFLGIGLFINLIKNRFRLYNLAAVIMILALLSTFSTTGYLMLFLNLLFYLINVNIRYSLVIFLPLLLLLSSSIVYDRLNTYFIEDIELGFEARVGEAIDKSKQYDKKYTLQRVTSFYIDIIDFSRNPILGSGGETSDRWINTLGANVVSISGIGKIFSKFGLVGFLFFFTGMYKSSSNLARINGCKGKFILMGLLLILSISYSTIEHPIFMSFWLFDFFNTKN